MLGLGCGFVGVGSATAQLAAYMQSGHWPSLSVLELLAYLASVAAPSWAARFALGTWPAAIVVSTLEAIPAAPVLIGVGVLTAWRILAASAPLPAEPPAEVDIDELRSRLTGPTLVVVSRRQPALAGHLKRELRGCRDVEILLDRRLRERRERVRQQDVERRRGDRRDPASPERDLRLHPVALIPRGGPDLFASMSAPHDPGG